MKAMVELRVLEMMGLVVSWTLELESYGKWCSAFGNWFYPLQNCRLTVLKQGMDELTVSLFIIETQLTWHLSAAGSCHLRKFSSFWTLFKNPKGYQHLWNRERKNSLFTKQNFSWMKHLGTESEEGEPAMISYIFVFASTVKMEAIHTAMRLILFSNRLQCTMGLSMSCMKTVFCGQSYLINARDKLPFQGLSRAERIILNS